MNDWNGKLECGEISNAFPNVRLDEQRIQLLSRGIGGVVTIILLLIAFGAFLVAAGILWLALKENAFSGGSAGLVFSCFMFGVGLIGVTGKMSVHECYDGDRGALVQTYMFGFSKKEIPLKDVTHLTMTLREEIIVRAFYFDELLMKFDELDCPVDVVGVHENVYTTLKLAHALGCPLKVRCELDEELVPDKELIVVLKQLQDACTGPHDSSESVGW